MRKQLSKRNTAELAVLMGLIFTAVMSFARFDAACETKRFAVTYNRKFKFRGRSSGEAFGARQNS